MISVATVVGMHRFKSRVPAQRFLDVHAVVYNIFNLGPHLPSARHHQESRHSAFAFREKAMAASYDTVGGILRMELTCTRICGALLCFLAVT